MMILRFASAGRLFSFCERNKAAGMAAQPDSFAGNLTGIGGSPQQAIFRRRKAEENSAHRGRGCRVPLLANLFTMAYIPWLYVAEKLRFLYNCIQT